MNEQKRPLDKYLEAFNKNSINLKSLDVREDQSKFNNFFKGPSLTNIELTFETYNEKASNPNTLFFLILNALFTERYGMGVKEFENTYPEVVI